MRKRGRPTEWTTKQIQQVADLRGRGYKAAEIAEVTGLPYGSVRGKLQELVAAGKIPKHCVTPRRYTPTDVRDQKIRALTDHVLDWVWAHPGAHFKVSHQRADGDKWFTFRYEGAGRQLRRVGINGTPHWSEFALCTVDNLRTLLAALRRIDLEGEQ